MSTAFYNTIEAIGSAEFKDRGSRFIATAMPIQHKQDFKACLAQIKKEHPKANHHCYAYRMGFDGSYFKVSDDGEPSGTAGRPILGQIDSKQLTNILVIVARYFGGTLLGTSGLLQAYKSATALVLQVIPVVRKPVLDFYKLQYDYTVTNDVMYIIKQLQCEIISQQAQLFNEVKVGIPRNRLQEALNGFKHISNLTVEEIKSTIA